MENLSHSVAGLVAGELIHRSFPPEPTPEKESTRHRLLLWTTALAGNFPDLDLILTPLLPSPLGYLLHHRGHTHTFLYAIPQALFLFLLTWIVWPKARAVLRESQHAKVAYGLALVCGFSLHLAMDFLNSYGLHPFHPFDSHWYFGDMVFIVEPFFWISLGVPMCLLVRSRWIRGACLTFLLGAPLFFAFKDYLSWWSMTLLLSVATLSLLVNRRALLKKSPRSRTPFVTAFALALGFVGVQAVASAVAKRELSRKVTELDSRAASLDASIHSFPTNPFCWNFLTIEKNEKAGTYTLRKGLLSLWPQMVKQSACPSGLLKGETLDSTSNEISFFDTYTGDLAKLRELSQTDCHFEAWLRFVRAPVVQEDRAWDARFSSSAAGNFSTLLFSNFKTMACSKLIPGWRPPRADLLESSTKD
jgi:inner membrane protein